jgi:hypothetical protein
LGLFRTPSKDAAADDRVKRFSTNTNVGVIRDEVCLSYRIDLNA